MSHEVIVKFDGLTSAEQGALVSSLNDELNGIEGVERTQIRRARQDTLDAGTILTIVLAGPAVVIAVKAFAAWMVRKNQSYVTLETPDGQKLYAGNLSSSDVPKVLDALSKV